MESKRSNWEGLLVGRVLWGDWDVRGGTDCLVDACFLFVGELVEVFPCRDGVLYCARGGCHCGGGSVQLAREAQGAEACIERCRVRSVEGPARRSWWCGRRNAMRCDGVRLGAGSQINTRSKQQCAAKRHVIAVRGAIRSEICNQMGSRNGDVFVCRRFAWSRVAFSGGWLCAAPPPPSS